MTTITKTTPTKVVIRLSKMNGEMTRVEIPFDEATTNSIAGTVISIIQTGMSMDIGDMITVTATP